MTIAATAARLLTTYGDPVSVVFESGGDIDPATGVVTDPVTETPTSAYGYLSRYRTSDVDGSVIQAGDIRLILEKLSRKPNKGERCTADGATYRIMDVQDIRYKADTVITICQLRAN